jgi:alanine dehydrogenase
MLFAPRAGQWTASRQVGIHLKVAVVKEIKPQESRVALTPAGVDRLVAAGHSVIVETGAGIGSSLPDSAYTRVGAVIAESAEAAWAEADMVVKVKEPLSSEWPMMRAGQILFTYLHLAADRALTDALMATGSHCFAYETLSVGGALPLLTPMSEVAGRMSIQAGAKCLERHQGGLGVLLGGVPGVAPARVLILGGGVVGTQAARMASGMGADVTILDLNLDRLRYLDEILPPNCRTLYSTPMAVRQALKSADLVVGAVLIPGGAAPKLVRREDLSLMKPGAVIVDVAVDQGGCIETCHPTTHDDPTFEVDGVVHYCVANMPGAVPRTSTFALSNATLPFVIELANKGAKVAIDTSDALASAANAVDGKLTCAPVGEAFGIESVDPRVVSQSL